MHAVQDETFDVLLLDMNYARDTTSGSEGLELLSRLREFDNALPVVVMTAWASVELAVEAMQDGGRDFVQKPWDNKKLLESLRRQIENGRLQRDKNREIEDAHQIQRRLLPAGLPALPGVDFQAFWKPAKEVGGDYFDAIRLTNTSAAFCIADVAGKGLPAALLMSNLQANVRALAGRSSSPAEICRQLNRVARENTRPERFTTLFYAVLDSARSSLRYCNAGHVPPILVRGNGTIERLSEGGTVLGVFSAPQYDESEVTLTNGDRVVLVTDGITEATNDRGEEFGDDRLIPLLLEYRELSAGELQKTLVETVRSFAGQPLQDDATVMIVAMDGFCGGSKNRNSEIQESAI
jgi:sigma-B regulation protein RsbU (phosphoserine phosphatase)